MYVLSESVSQSFSQHSDRQTDIQSDSQSSSQLTRPVETSCFFCAKLNCNQLSTVARHKHDTTGLVVSHSASLAVFCPAGCNSQSQLAYCFDQRVPHPSMIPRRPTLWLRKFRLHAIAKPPTEGWVLLEVNCRETFRSRITTNSKLLGVT